jgi:hypothetical protein
MLKLACYSWVHLVCFNAEQFNINVTWYWWPRWHLLALFTLNVLPSQCLFTEYYNLFSTALNESSYIVSYNPGYIGINSNIVFVWVHMFMMSLITEIQLHLVLSTYRDYVNKQLLASAMRALKHNLPCFSAQLRCKINWYGCKNLAIFVTLL